MGWKESLIEHDESKGQCAWCGRDPVFVTYHAT